MTLIKSLLTVLAFAMLATMNISTPAAAETKMVISVDCKRVSNKACDIIKASVGKAPYVGPLRPADEPMACARVVSKGQVPVVWIEGNESNYDSSEARVIADTSIVYTEVFALNASWTVTESCIPARLLNGVSELTLCTGQYEDGFHWNLSNNELREMKATGHFQSYVPFLTDNDRNKLSKSSVEAAYKARYGTKWVMPNS